ncbi:MAG: SDR family NAD(P)-dependent oxidoreductase [Armatimonadota bacterium]
MGDLRKCAFITGGAQGMGKATAHRLLSAGWAVTIADIDEEAGLEAQAELGALGPIAFQPTDVADEGQVARALRETVMRFGGLDLVMNNAYATHWMHVTEVDIAEWNRVLAVNLTSIFLTTRYAEPYLRARRGSIVNIASVHALTGLHSNAEAYAATKGAIVAITNALAVSLAPEIRVNCISPGYVDSYPWAKSSKRRINDYPAYRHTQHPGGRIGKPEDIAAAVAFLASPAAGFITGENLVVDGGMTKKVTAEIGESSF